MALFGNSEKKQEKQEARDQQIMEKYGLQNIRDPKTAESLRFIGRELMGNGFLETGALLSLKAKSEDLVQMSCQRAIVDQNFILIRQMDELIGLLKNGQN